MTEWAVHTGDCLEVMAGMEANSVDAVVTDPPYGLAFMGKAWDHAVPGPEFFAAMLRVAKPGAHLVAFGGTRLYHRMTCAMEDAGWEIRDCLMWLYGSGFPKSHNGPWGGTALKPAWEPIVLARKPLDGTVAQNHLRHGCGGVNVDGCRIGWANENERAEVNARSGPNSRFATGIETSVALGAKRPHAVEDKTHAAGRWPANLVLDAEAGAVLDGQAGDRGGGFGNRGALNGGSTQWGFDGHGQEVGYGDSGGASRFFYCPKASKADREEGNNHPTVKPTDLMRWLCRLVTPAGGTVLDPFTGSGSTGKAARLEGFNFIGIEREPEYADIARARIAAIEPTLIGGLA